MIFFDKEIELKDLGGGVSRKVKAHGGTMLMAEVSFEKGAVGAVHTHPHEQVCYVAEGSFEFEADGKKTIISKGDSYYVEPNAPHGVVALEKGVLIDIFTPQREDFLD